MLLRYLAARMRYRERGVRRYLQMGLGIERRAWELGEWWGPHQEKTRAAQRRWAERAGGETLMVLGAGRLLDFEEAALAGRFGRMRMVDGDPMCEKAWGRVGVPVEGVVTDVTQCVDEWRAELEGAERPGNWEAALERVRGVPRRVKGYTAGADGVLSLNLMSQLPVAWQEAAERYLRQHFRGEMILEREAEWLRAVAPGNQMLVEEHLAGLAGSGARHVLLITDVAYVEYRHQRYERGKWAAEPAELPRERTMALEELRLPEAFAEWMPGYVVMWSEEWWWHISPMGVECAECGTLHRVGAYALERG